VPLTRRRFGAIAGGALAALALGPALPDQIVSGRGGSARLRARPGRPAPDSAPATEVLGLDPDRDAILRVPSAVPASPLPLVVLLHGAGGRAERLLARFGPAADTAGVAVLAVDSRGPTWDAIRGDFGPDVTFIDRALRRTFEIAPVDAKRLAIGGFSDGATYALSLGVINGDLFRRIVAFSPGFLVEGRAEGRPRVFVSHGTRDEILPIDRTSRELVPFLRRSGYAVTFREFDGGHEVPAAVAAEGFAWITT
jgi:predicted esterase